MLGVKALGAVTSGSGYTDGIYEDVPLTGSSTGTGAKATIVVSAGAIVKTTLTDSGSGYLNTDTLSVAANSIGVEQVADSQYQFLQ